MQTNFTCPLINVKKQGKNVFFIRGHKEHWWLCNIWLLAANGQSDDIIALPCPILKELGLGNSPFDSYALILILFPFFALFIVLYI